MKGTLYVVGTPIGNMGDITFRAIEVLKSVDYIACEDTRVTLKLLNRYQIEKPLISYHQHSGIYKIEKIVSLICEGCDIALVSDAGTPGISDPGCQLVAEAEKNGIPVFAIPGPSALAAALSISGLSSKEFLFLGFLPHKKGRAKILSSLTAEEKTIILYESPHRIKRLLGELSDSVGNRQVAVFRELTKKFETVYRGTAESLVSKVKEKGEFTVIIEGTNGKR